MVCFGSPRKKLFLYFRDNASSSVVCIGKASKVLKNIIKCPPEKKLHPNSMG